MAKKCKNENGLNIHMGRCHPNQNPSRQSEEKKSNMDPKHERFDCGMMFPTKLHLHLHISVLHTKSISNEKEGDSSGCVCDICGQTFNNENIYKNHTTRCHDSEIGVKRVHKLESEDMIKVTQKRPT